MDIGGRRDLHVTRFALLGRAALLGVIIAAAAALTVHPLAGGLGVRVEDYGYATVRYGVGLPLPPPGLELTLKPAAGLSLGGARTTVTLYAWMPDGRLELIGVKSAAGLTVELSGPIYERLRRAYAEWAGYLAARGSDPSAVSVGLLALAAVESDGRLYGGAVVVPLKPGLVAARRPVSVEARVDLVDLGPARSPALGRPWIPARDPVPPSTPLDWYRGVWQCGTGGCYVWVLEELRYSLSDCLPYVLVNVWGDVSKVDRVELWETLVADEVLGYRVVFAATAAVASPAGGVHYTIPGYVWQASSRSVADLSFHKTFYRGVDFTSASVVYVGFYGDIAWGRYRLNYYVECVPGPVNAPAGYCAEWLVPTSIVANITLARPAGGLRLDNSLACHGVEKDPWLYPAEAGKVAWMYRMLYVNGWALARWNEGYGDVWVSNIDVGRELQTSPTLSAGVAPLALIAAITRAPVPPILAGVLATAVGVEQVRGMEYFAAAVADVDVRYGTSVLWKYMVSPVTYRHGEASNLRLGLLFVEVYVPGG